MKNWEVTLIAPDKTIRDALGVIELAACHLALVVDENQRLLGTASDGDIRRGLLRGLELHDTVTRVMQTTPTVCGVREDRHAILSMMRRHGLHQIPLLDDDKRVVGLLVVNDFLTLPPRDNWVVIMAGGLGSRLRDLTRDTPKPMLQVGSRPLLETIIRSFAGQGFGHFHLAVNYKAEQIEKHFGDGSSLGVEIQYIREQKRLGTAGALSLLPGIPDKPIIVTNADLLTKEDFGFMLDQHVDANADATMGVRDYEMQVPFGVVSEQAGRIASIEEKPVRRFTVNAGIYVLSPRVLPLVPKDSFFDMPSLFESLARHGMRARGHRISGYWLDIGQPPDYERANLEFPEVFS